MTHSADTAEELEALHPADRLMVRLIQLPHLADRVKGMLFQVRFRENFDLLKEVRTEILLLLMARVLVF